MRSLFYSFANKIFSFCGYSLTKKEQKSEILNNVFNTKHAKNALVSYIKNVFENDATKNDKTHTNRHTTFLIGEALNELGYNVDAINYNEDFKGDLSKYDLVIGLGKPLEDVLQIRKGDSKTSVIWFGTGCNPLYSNVITLQRVKDFYKRHRRIILSSSRYIKTDWPLQHEVSDWIILHGSSFAKSTYRTENISTINAPVFIVKTITRSEDEWGSAKNDYLWYGSDGAIHKGLDLLIDSFKDMPNCNLHICGNLERENEFMELYKPVIDSSPNIIYHGFVNIESENFEKIVRDCAFVISPSASEGNSPSVITCMANGGLIPIVSKNTDVELKGFGISIDELTVDAVTNSIKQSQKLSISELKYQSEKIINETGSFHSFDNFKKDFKQKLQEAISSVV